MSEQREMPEVLPGDLITRVGLYEARCGDIVRITGWRDGFWVSVWNGVRTYYSSDGRQRFDEGQQPNQWQLLHWIGPLPATEPEPETTTEQLVEIEGQAEDTPATQYTPTEHWRVLQVGEPLKGGDEYHEGLNRYIRPIEPEPQPQPQPQPEAEPVPQQQPESDAELRIRLLKQCNDNQAETIKRLMAEARDLNMEIGGLERQLLQRDARIRDLETMHAAASQAVVDAGKQNDALRVQNKILQQEAGKKNSRIEFLETLDAGNAVAIVDYRTKVAKLQSLVDTARQQLEAAATERDELRAAIDAADKQLDQKDAQIRDLRIELDAAQQVPQPVGDEEREQIWDDATEQAGQQVIRWLTPLTLALHRQPDERFLRFMALTLSVLPSILPQLLGYAVEDESGEE